VAARREVWHARRWNLPFWPLAVVVVVALGMWGFASLGPDDSGGPAPQPLGPLQVTYRTLRLFAFEFDLPPGAGVPPQLWIAAFAAPLLTLRGIARLFREQLSGVLTHYLVRPRLVVFGANEGSTALVAAEPRPGRWRDAIVVVDPDPAALEAVGAPRVWTVRGHGANVESLRRAGVLRAASLVVVTGDNTRNSAITAAVLDLHPPPLADLYVEVAEPGLARTLEQGGHRVGVETVPFSAPVLAAAAVLDELEAERRDAGRPPLLAAEDGGAGATIVLFGTGSLVDAVVLELHRRRQIQLLGDPETAHAAPRVVLLGPDAVARRHSLGVLVGTELQLLPLDAYDVRLDQVVELDMETARHLSRSRPLRQVLVLAPTDLDGGGIAITLAGHLGPGARIVLVTESGSTPFGDEIEEQSRISATRAEVVLRRVPQLAYRLPVLQGERLADRLGRALQASDDPGAGPGAWNSLAPADRERHRRSARERVAAAGAGAVPLRRSALVAAGPAEIPLLEALGFDRPTALARAGLGVDFQAVTALLPAARRLLTTGHDAAFGAWCEVARLLTAADDLAEVQPERSADPAAGDVRNLVLLRRAGLRDADARILLRLPESDADPPGGVATVLFAGPSDGPDVLSLLEPALAGPPLRAVAPPGRLRDELARRGVRLGDVDLTTRRQGLAAWAAVTAAGRTERARAIVLPGAAAEDVLLARALGAMVGRLDGPGAPDLSHVLLNGATGVVPLPRDRMTVRAFLRPGGWPAALRDRREPIAAELHRRYVARQRARKRQDDIALQPWPALSPWLQRSNLAVVDDIPAKLAAVGLRLDDDPTAAADSAVAAVLRDHTELLAELEHGRYTAERLLMGWTNGVRDPARFLSPHLQPWTELDEEAKEYDREVVRDLPEVLARHGLAIRAAAGPASAGAVGERGDGVGQQLRLPQPLDDVQ
jgi:hypothetical protein